MTPNNSPNDSPRDSLGGALKMIAGLVIIALATLAGLTALDIVPLDKLAPWAGRLLLLGGAVVVAALALALLFRRGAARDENTK